MCTKIRNVEIKNTTSCGHCNDRPKEFWLQQTWGALRLDPNQELPDEWGQGNKLKVICLCDCGGQHTTSFNNLVYGYTQSCGCIKQGCGSFSPAYEIYEYVKSLVPDAIFSYWFKDQDGNRREYDIYVPSKKLAIEYHGLYWHSEANKRDKNKRDYQKYKDAINNGIHLIQIYQDEWINKKEIVKGLLTSLLSGNNGRIRIKPKFEVLYKSTNEINQWLNQFHYLGCSGGNLVIVARYKDSIVGACSA